MNRRTVISAAVFAFVATVSLQAVYSAEEFIPRKQTKMPGPALSPDEAIKQMTVPPGFSVEVVAAEPQIVNPVAMTFDERGRIWVTESFEYPRSSAGPGRDRIKVLEDTDHDGRVDQVTVFAEGLNIPSGIAVGAGGVWVANAPDLLFMQDTDGDGRADKQEVVVTGFGRTDTHELPNSLTWGPDGWLYGLNGVFNQSHIEYRGKTYDFTCAMFRIHPYSRDFELFCEGTSNPWGIAFNNDGEAFVSACVIDHLWHLTETGYYHRQGGPYPPFTWKIESIVDHKHQLAAYCGIHWFDSDAYPDQFREKLYMGNIHGNCINVDRLERNASTYRGHGEPDFLTANDVWFMPVVQKTGPDGCLYILDWYDRYHCYQDARRDPEGIDRLKGRLYRVRYHNTPRAPKFDLAQETDEQLIERLKSPNVFYRDLAQRLLWERKHPETMKKLESLVLDSSADRKARMHALWARIGSGPLDEKFHLALMTREMGGDFYAWGIRAARNQPTVSDAVRLRIGQSCELTSNPDAQLQAAITIPRINQAGGVSSLVLIANNCSADDPLLPNIIWNNLQPYIESQPQHMVRQFADVGPAKSPVLSAITPRLLERLLALRPMPAADVGDLLESLFDDKPPYELLGKSLALLSSKIQTGELNEAHRKDLLPEIDSVLDRALKLSDSLDTVNQAAWLAATLRHSEGLEATRRMLAATDAPNEIRLRALQALVAARDEGIVATAKTILTDEHASSDLRRGVIDALGQLESADVGLVMVDVYPRLPADSKPQAVELLTQRDAWSQALLAAVAAKRIPTEAVNINQVRRLTTSKNPSIAEPAAAVWGSVRADRDPMRELVIANMRLMIRNTPGDATRGQQAFTKLCAQCHKLHGQGQEVGPDITANGRASFDQLLSNVFDPSLVIGPSYQARTLVTDDGRSLTGLLAEDSPQRVVLKVQGGKLEVIPRDQIDEMAVSKLSLMPEGVERQYAPQEIADLFAYLTLDKPPTDPAAQPIPGARPPQPMETNDPERWAPLVAEVAPGFTVLGSGERGVGLVAEHFDRRNVLRTHPIDARRPAILRTTLQIPADKRARLLLDVSHDPRGDWQLVVRAGDKSLLNTTIGPKSTTAGWAHFEVDLAPVLGQKAELEILNQPNNWSFEYAYWGRVQIVVE